MIPAGRSISQINNLGLVDSDHLNEAGDVEKVEPRWFKPDVWMSRSDGVSERRIDEDLLRSRGQ